MRRRIGTFLSVVGLLAVGTAAAAVNVRILHGSADGPATYSMRDTGDIAALRPDEGRTDNDTALPDMRPVPGPGAVGDGQPDAGAAAVNPLPKGTRHPADPGQASGSPERTPPQLTQAQLRLLRVAAMVRLDPQTVLEVARGQAPDPQVSAAVKQAAEAVGTDLKELAQVQQLPPRPERGNGGDAEHHGDGDGDQGDDLVQVTSNDD